MDRLLLQEITRMRRLVSRHGQPFDLMRFTIDSAYARATLEAVLETGDAEVRLVGQALMETMFPPSSEPTPVRSTAPHGTS
jgi:hypothetical protein